MHPLQNDILASIIEILGDDLAPEDRIHRLGSILKTAIPFDRFSISLSEMRYWYFLQNDIVTTERNTTRYDDKLLASTWVFLHQEPLLRGDVSSENRFAFDTILSDESMSSHLIVPLVVNGMPFGTFNFFKKSTHFYDPSHLDLAVFLRHAVAHLAKEISENLDSEALNTVTQALLNTTNAETMHKLILTHLQRKFDRVRLYVYDSRRNQLQGRMQMGDEGFVDISNHTYPIADDPYTQRTLSAEWPQIYKAEGSDHENWLKQLNEESILDSSGTREWAEIALTSHRDGRDTFLGKLAIDNSRTQIRLSQKLLDLQTVFLRYAATALEQARERTTLAAQVEQRTRQLSATNHILEEKDALISSLQEVSHRSFSYLNRDELLDNFAKQIIQAGIFRSLMIALVDSETETIEVVRAFQTERPDGPDGRIELINYEETCGTRYRLDDENITPLTARTGELQMVVSKSDTRLDQRLEEGVRWNDKVAYFIPVRRGEKVVAVLATGTVRKDRESFVNRLKLLEPLFDQLGIALEHAALHARAIQNEARYRSLFVNMQSAFAYHQIVTDETGNPVDYRFLEVNPAFEKLMAIGRENIVGRCVSEIIPAASEDPINWVSRYGQVALTGEPMQTKVFSKALGKWVHVSAYSPLERHFAAVFTDITERKRSEERLDELHSQVVQLERLKALGELAAGVSHNLNNMLTGILLPAAMLADSPLHPDDREKVNDILVSARRARDLVVQLNQSVRKDGMEKTKSVSVNRALSEVLQATRARWQNEADLKGIAIRMNLQLRDDAQINATESGLHDVLVNLIFNAVDALPDGGQIDLGTEIMPDRVRIFVKDNGIGMSTDVQSKIFEPFFTTKVNVGTGLGLSTAHNQVSRWGGELLVESKPGRGSVFCVTLPRWNGLHAVPDEGQIPVVPRLRILIVEDDAFVRRSLAHCLKSQHVLTLVETGTQAIEATNHNEFDLAVIDLGLPDVSGDDLARLIRNRLPQLPLILMTGWSLAENDPKRQPFDAYLQKPITDPKMVMDAIDYALKKSAE
ncbi:MAG: ATP-binding protein [bacterium]|nr:ATP-binding protein [bacterium]